MQIIIDVANIVQLRDLRPPMTKKQLTDEIIYKMVKIYLIERLNGT